MTLEKSRTMAQSFNDTKKKLPISLLILLNASDLIELSSFSFLSSLPIFFTITINNNNINNKYITTFIMISFHKIISNWLAIIPIRRRLLPTFRVVCTARLTVRISSTTWNLSWRKFDELFPSVMEKSFAILVSSSFSFVVARICRWRTAKWIFC